ncbi:MAG TPA: CAP domain-containing protein [Telluria sp.]|nr:CAP domain-containing protein [Telluria sp.]
MNLSLPAKPICSLLAAAAVLAAAPARANDSDDLIRMINDYRAAPGSCEGRRVAPLPPLKVNRALAQLGIASSNDLKRALENADYTPRHAEAAEYSGLSDVRGVMTLVRDKSCRMVLDPRFADIGAVHSGGSWQIVLAQPLLENKMKDWKEAGRTILRAANAARAQSRSCGGQDFPPAPPLKWNPTLGEAALDHSRDMAHEANLSHQGSDGSTAGKRATRAGYVWTTVGENIMLGVGTAEEAVAGWVNSPGHCVNLMNPAFTEMGAAYAIDNERRGGNIYWTQVLAAPRR